MSGTAANVKQPSTVPDSTFAEQFAFVVGEDVLVSHDDGFFYFGTVVKVDQIQAKCLVQFGDNTESWSSYKVLKKIKIQEESKSLCAGCRSAQSSPGNDIVTCQQCQRGYHLGCHFPPIPNVLCGDIPPQWVCSKCPEGKRMLNANLDACFEETSMKSSLETKDVAESHKVSVKCFPYNPCHLEWDPQHRSNVQGKYCYCGQPGDWYRRMLQCCRCLQWFHEYCLQVLDRPLLFGDRFYLFLCSVCDTDGQERIVRLSEELTLTDIVHLALYNLSLETGRKYHDLDTVILPFLESRWENLQLSEKITALTTNERRHEVFNVLWQNKIKFICGREIKKKATMWGLRTRIPPAVPANLSTRSSQILHLWSRQSREPANTSNDLKESLEPVTSKSAKSRKVKRLNSSQVSTARVLRARQRRPASDDSMVEDEENNYDKGFNRSRRSKLINSQLDAPITLEETSSDEASLRGTLDSRIPPLQNFTGVNNPFYRSNSGSSCKVRPLRSRTNAHTTWSENSDVGKPKSLWEKQSSSQTSLRSLPSNVAKKLLQSYATCCFKLESKSVTLQAVTEQVISCFETNDVGCGFSGYGVLGKRILPSGKVQYLVKYQMHLERKCL